MNIKGIIIILAAICVGLGIALFMTRKQAADQHAADVNSLTEYSNQVVDAHERLTEAGQVNLTLSNELAASQQQLTLGAEQAAQLSNRLAAADTALTDTQAALDDARTALAGARGQVTNLTTHVSELEARNTFLSQQAEALRGNLAQLTRDIENTRNQLAVTKTNAAFLQGELQKQLAQKAELSTNSTTSTNCAAK
jgi:chromosome segregation ATPase